MFCYPVSIVLLTFYPFNRRTSMSILSSRVARRYSVFVTSTKMAEFKKTNLLWSCYINHPEQIKIKLHVSVVFFVLWQSFIAQTNTVHIFIKNNNCIGLVLSPINKTIPQNSKIVRWLEGDSRKNVKEALSWLLLKKKYWAN